jgi:glutathione S-transferase
MKLYGVALSPYVARVLLCVRHKGLDIPLAQPPGGDFKSPEYLAINPYGKMPALSGDEGHVIESEVINEYLDERFPDPPMLPATPLERARCRTVARAVDLYVLPPLLGLLGQLNPVLRDDEAVGRIRGDLKKGLDGLEPLLHGRWAVGETMTLADCALIPTLFYVQKFVPPFGVPEPLQDYPALTRLWAHAQGSPVVTTLLDEMNASLKRFMEARGMGQE